MYKLLTWDKFREMCKEDAQTWYNNGYSNWDLSPSDILAEYPDDYIDLIERVDCDDLSNCFTPADIAVKTLVYLEELCNEDKEDLKVSDILIILMSEHTVLHDDIAGCIITVDLNTIRFDSTDYAGYKNQISEFIRDREPERTTVDGSRIYKYYWRCEES